eukprot:g526.t1 g526   contig10:219567-224867(-)
MPTVTFVYIDNTQPTINNDDNDNNDNNNNNNIMARTRSSLAAAADSDDETGIDLDESLLGVSSSDDEEANTHSSNSVNEDGDAMSEIDEHSNNEVTVVHIGDDDVEEDNDETMLEEDSKQSPATASNTTNNVNANDNEMTTPAHTTFPQNSTQSQPLALRGGGYTHSTSGGYKSYNHNNKHNYNGCNMNPSAQSSTSPYNNKPGPATTKRISAKERLRKLAELMDSDDDDDDDTLTEEDFLKAVARRQAEQRKRMGGGGGGGMNDHQQHHQQQNESFRNESMFTQDTTIMGNNSTTLNNNTSHYLNAPRKSLEVSAIEQSESQLFAATQPWEREFSLLDGGMPGGEGEQGNTYGSSKVMGATCNSQHNAMPPPCSKPPVRVAVANPYNEQSRTRTTTTTVHHETAPRALSATQANIQNNNVPKMSFENLRRRRSSFGNNYNKSKNNAKSGWQEDAFRSSLLDLINAFPSTYISSDEISSSERTAKDSSSSALCTNHGINSTPTKTGNKSKSGGRPSDDSPINSNNIDDFNPPSPRSLPSFMSVMNVHGAEGDGSDYWSGGDSSSASSYNMSASKDVFTGQSVHGRNARTVTLWSGPEESGPEESGPEESGPEESGPEESVSKKSTTSREDVTTWTLEQLAFGGMKIAAQVCCEASRDKSKTSPHTQWNDGVHSEATSCLVEGFAQTSTSETDIISRGVSPALVESSLEFLASAFACLESDVVYSVLRMPVRVGSGQQKHVETAFDVLCDLAPVGYNTSSNDTHQVSNVSMLALVTLSRGLETAHYVARYAASLDPSASCSAYTSPYSILEGNSSNFGMDEGGVGWLSAIGRDLGLSLESKKGNSPPRHVLLSRITEYAYDFILDFNPMITEDSPTSFQNSEQRNSDKRVRVRDGLFVDTKVGQQSDGFLCRQPSVVKDRIYAAYVEYMSSMIHIGVVSGWLSTAPASVSGTDANSRTVEKLCQKLFFVIETRARLRRSTNQSTAKIDPGDSEAVCASSLSLLVLTLPKHEDPSSTSSLSTSFRQMGSSTGTIGDLFQSPLVQKMVDLALSPSWDDGESNSSKSSSRSKDHDASINCHALTYAMYVLSDVVMVGGAPLLLSHFDQRLNECLSYIIEVISKADGSRYTPQTEAAIVFMLHLHNGCPVMVRRCLRDFLETTSPCEDECDNATLFVGGLFTLCSHKSFAVSSSSSSLLRALLHGSPLDSTPDVLSDMIRHSLETALVGSAMDCSLNSLIDASYSFVDYGRCVPTSDGRWLPRICSLSDLLGVCLPSESLQEILVSTLSLPFRESSVMDVFAHTLERNSGGSSLCGSVTLSLLFLFGRFALSDTFPLDNEADQEQLLDQLRVVREKLATVLGYQGIGLKTLEKGMTQGISSDMTYRALKLQNCFSMSSLFSERTLALSFTRTSSFMRRREEILYAKIEQSDLKLGDMSSKCERLESECENLVSSLHDQRLSYERKLGWARSEEEMASRSNAEIHVQERRRAEERASQYEISYRTEMGLRLSLEEKNRRIADESKQLKQQLVHGHSRMEELEKLLEQERRSSQDYASALESSKNELSAMTEKLDSTSNAVHDLQSKLSHSEHSVSELSATNEDMRVNLEDMCDKLIKLSCIYQNKESEMNRYKDELRKAVVVANKNADTAISEYESAKATAKSLRKELDETISELNELKAHKAEVQRQRKNAPITYINQLRNDPRVQKEPSRKESFRERELIQKR